MAEDFAVTTEATPDDKYVVAVRGAISLFTSPRFREALLQAIDGGRDRVVVDLCETTFIDSSGMAALIAARKRIARHPRGCIVIACAAADLMAGFEVAGLPQLLRFEPTRDAALAALDATGP
jgi:anti-sigma B factor antagonist